ncbi:MAG: PriCT-2 domain-containing protein [Proteobacteria bacterium]|nr:PriCT-2 domain-containing protein [Pseudomonadota bacterium]
MRISRKAAMQFKKFLHQLKQANFLAVPEKVGMKSKPRTLYGTLKRIWGEVEELNQSGHAVFMGVNETKGEGRTSSNVAKVTALVADYDGGEWSVKDLKKFLKKFEVKPDMVNETSPGNFHVYWLVKDVPLDKFKPVQQLLAMHYGTDEKVCDLSRAMRMPGTINWKHDEPFLVRTVYVNDDAKPVSLKKFFVSTFGALAWEGFSSSYSPNSVAVAVVAAADSSKGDVARVVKALEPIPADDRQLWVTVGMALKNEFGDSGLQMFKDWSAKSPKYDEQELERQWKSFKPARDKSGGITIGTVFWLSKIYAEMNDLNGENTVWPSSLLELSERFADASTHMLKHCEQDNAFYACRNGRWQRSRHSAERVGIEFLMAMKAAASKSGNEKVQDFLDKHQSHGSARELLRAAQSNTLLAVAPNAFDKAENVLGVKLPAVEGAIDRHAVVDLLKKTFRLAKPSDMLLRIAGAEYDRSAKCPLWVDFIDAVTEGDTDLADFLQLAVGYTLYGHAKEQVLFILIGSGGNGMGVFSRIVFALMGDYSAILQNNLLKPGAINANSPSPALMKLMGKRLWVCSEVPKGMVRNVPLHLHQSDLDGACGPHCALMALMLFGILDRVDLDGLPKARKRRLSSLWKQTETRYFVGS